jgi:general secretion pathway protein D
VITASKQDYEVVQNLLAKIDIPRDQVFVEGIIMEMNTDKQRSWNPVYYYLDPASNGVGRAGFSRGGTLGNILNPAGDSGTILGFGTGTKLKFAVGGTTVEVPNLLSFIQLLQQNVESNVLSTPQILALDNEEAEIEVGDNIPIAQDQQTLGQTISTNTRFEKATIKLNITPYIRPNSDVVRLKINQSVKQPSNTVIRSTKLAESTTIISDRSIKTNIVVHNGDTAVLGGLIRDEETVDEVKIPILGDIPVLGWLFKSSTINKKKINLVIFLTPKIIRNMKDSQNLLSTRTNERIDWIKKNFDGRDPYGKKMDNLPRAARSGSEDELDLDKDVK